MDKLPRPPGEGDPEDRHQPGGGAFLTEEKVGAQALGGTGPMSGGWGVGLVWLRQIKLGRQVRWEGR